MPVPYTDVRASLPLQVALYFNGYYSAAFFVVTLLLFIYKGAPRVARCDAAWSAISQPLTGPAGIMLPYPTAAIGLEVAFVFAWAIVEAARIYLGAVCTAMEVFFFRRRATPSVIPLRLHRLARKQDGAHRPASCVYCLDSARHYLSCLLHSPPNIRVRGGARVFILPTRGCLCVRLCRMRLDQIINGIALAFDGFEVLMSLFAVLSFVRARRF